MHKPIENKSRKTLDRIMEIQLELASYRDSIELLIQAIKKNSFLYKIPFGPRNVKYSCIPISEKCFQWTLHNIREEVKLLERELETLILYGA